MSWFTNPPARTPTEFPADIEQVKAELGCPAPVFSKYGNGDPHRPALYEVGMSYPEKLIDAALAELKEIAKKTAQEAREAAHVAAKAALDAAKAPSANRKEAMAAAKVLAKTALDAANVAAKAALAVVQAARADAKAHRN